MVTKGAGVEGVSSLYVSHDSLVKGKASGFGKPNIKQSMHILLSKVISIFVMMIYDLRCGWQPRPRQYDCGIQTLTRESIMQVKWKCLA